MSRAYSLIVLSDEKKPLPAVDMMDMRVHLALSLYVSSTRSCTGAHSTISPCVAHTCIKHTFLLITQQSIQAFRHPITLVQQMCFPSARTAHAPDPRQSGP